MQYLWSRSRPANPAEVHSVVAPDLAYTTIMTVLTRLWAKGHLDRERRGRAYWYSPVRSEAEHRASSMRSVMNRAGDSEAVLSNFVESLSPAESETLRRLLDDDRPDDS